LHWDWLDDSGFNLEEHGVYNEGCSTQFKCAIATYFVVKYPILTKGCKMRLNSFASAHGKGKWDGTGAIVKRALSAKQNQNLVKQLANATQIVNFLQENYTK